VDRVYGLFRRWSVRWSFFVFFVEVTTIPVYTQRERDVMEVSKTGFIFHTHTCCGWFSFLAQLRITR